MTLTGEAPVGGERGFDGARLHGVAPAFLGDGGGNTPARLGQRGAKGLAASAFAGFSSSWRRRSRYCSTSASSASVRRSRFMV